MPSKMARVRERFSTTVRGRVSLWLDDVTLGKNAERTIEYDDELDTLVVVEHE